MYPDSRSQSAIPSCLDSDGPYNMETQKTGDFARLFFISDLHGFGNRFKSYC
jgi:hypothetical protein